MSPKTSALVTLYVTILLLAVPGLATVFLTDGYTRVAAGVTLGGAVVGIIFHAYQTAIGQLSSSKVAARGFARTVILAMLSVFAILLLVCCAATKADILSADNVAIDLTDTVCAPLENQTAGQPYVDFICTLIEGTEDIIAQAETAPDAGLVALKSVKSVKVRVPAAEAPQFMAAHRTSLKSGVKGGAS